MLILLVAGLAIWASLPERTKEAFLDAFSDQTVQQAAPKGQ